MIGDIGALTYWHIPAVRYTGRTPCRNFCGEGAVVFVRGREGAAVFHQQKRLGEQVLFSGFQCNQGGQAIEGRHLIVVFCDDLAVGGVACADSVALHRIFEPLEGRFLDLAALCQMVNGHQRLGHIDRLTGIAVFVGVVLIVVQRKITADKAFFNDRKRLLCQLRGVGGSQRRGV